MDKEQGRTLIDAYVCDKLDSAQVDDFEELMFVDGEFFEEVRLAQAMADGIRHHGSIGTRDRALPRSADVVALRIAGAHRWMPWQAAAALLLGCSVLLNIWLVSGPAVDDAPGAISGAAVGQIVYLDIRRSSDVRQVWVTQPLPAIVPVHVEVAQFDRVASDTRYRVKLQMPSEQQFESGGLQAQDGDIVVNLPLAALGHYELSIVRESPAPGGPSVLDREVRFEVKR